MVLMCQSLNALDIVVCVHAWIMNISLLLLSLHLSCTPLALPHSVHSSMHSFSSSTLGLFGFNLKLSLQLPTLSCFVFFFLSLCRKYFFEGCSWSFGPAWAFKQASHKLTYNGVNSAKQIQALYINTQMQAIYMWAQRPGCKGWDTSFLQIQWQYH